MVDNTTVLVVGAGPTGLLLASEPRRRNVECRVIDAHQVPLHWDRATLVHPRSLELFDSLGFSIRYWPRVSRECPKSSMRRRSD
jgi:2-polyprenyl-6-methoxyphenol hydroxylase-like FAD-dependent oxidoreductase